MCSCEKQSLNFIWCYKMLYGSLRCQENRIFSQVTKTWSSRDRCHPLWSLNLSFCLNRLKVKKKKKKSLKPYLEEIKSLTLKKVRVPDVLLLLQLKHLWPWWGIRRMLRSNLAFVDTVCMCVCVCVCAHYLTSLSRALHSYGGVQKVRRISSRGLSLSVCSHFTQIHSLTKI